MRNHDLCRAVSAASVLAVAMLAGCAPAAGGEPAASEPAGEVPAAAPEDCGGPATDIGVLTGGIILDYEPQSLPELVAEYPVVVIGTVHEYTQGREVREWNSDAGYHDTYEYWAVMAIEVETVHKGGEHVHDGQVYVNVSRGVEGVDEDGEPLGAGGTVTTLADLAAGVPPGTRVAVLGEPFNPRPYPTEKWIGTHRGYPDGATLITTHVQGLIVEDGETCAAASPWHPWDMSFGELEQRLGELAD